VSLEFAVQLDHNSRMKITSLAVQWTKGGLGSRTFKAATKTRPLSADIRDMPGWMRSALPAHRRIPAPPNRAAVRAQWKSCLGRLEGIRTNGRSAIVLATLFLLQMATAHAQSVDPWSTAAGRLSTAFVGPIAKGFTLVAIVLGGFSLAFSEGGGKRAVGGLVFGGGLAMGAAQTLTWLFG
jgi:type IV secretion system protein TrbC